MDVPRVVVDHRPTGDASLDREILGSYRDLGVAVLLGDHLDDPLTVSRLSTARRTVEAGVTTIATITGRTRSDIDRARLIDGFIEAETAAVLCVTGDHPAARFDEHDPVDFVTEGTRLANDARRAGAVVAVAESPSAPPGAGRSVRLRTKQDAGADIAILNHAGTVSEMLEFCSTVRDGGVDLALIAPVPVMTDRRSVDALAQFPGVVLDVDDVRRILESPADIEVGVGIAAASARRLLADGSIAGVNLSGVATGAGPRVRNRIMCMIAEQLTER